MQIISIAQMPRRASTRPRLLLAKASTIWLWPGIPLTMLKGESVVPIPPDAIRFWLSRFMGPEIVGQPMPMYIAKAAEHLTAGDEASAQHALDRSPAETLSPEGAMLACSVARRLRISVPEMPVAKRMPLWDRRLVDGQALLFDRFAETADWLDKANRWDERWEAGSSEGKPGAFRPGNGRSSPSVPSVPRPDPNRPGIGHNGGPPLFEDVPKVPAEDPGPSKRSEFIKTVAKWAAKQLLIMSAEDLIAGRLGLLLNAAQVAYWIYEYYPYIKSYTDPPQSLEDLERAAQGPSRAGYDKHHIALREAGRKGDVPTQLIDSGENLVSIPTLKHWEFHSWYQTANPEFQDATGNWMTPRDYLAGKDYEERRRVGLVGLRAIGVLK